MRQAPIESNEDERLGIVHELGILDTKPSPEFDALTKEAVNKFHVPISTVTIIDKDREWFKSCQGINYTEGPRKTSFCGHAMYSKGIFVIEDTLEDDRFKDNPQVVDAPFIRFYAGVPLYHYESKMPIGVFCIKDVVPRKFSIEEINSLIEIAEQAEILLNQKL